jgi:hypothetical protein
MPPGPYGIVFDDVEGLHAVGKPGNTTRACRAWRACRILKTSCWLCVGVWHLKMAALMTLHLFDWRSSATPRCARRSYVTLTTSSFWCSSPLHAPIHWSVATTTFRPSRHSFTFQSLSLPNWPTGYIDISTVRLRPLSSQGEPFVVFNFGDS